MKLKCIFLWVCPLILTTYASTDLGYPGLAPQERPVLNLGSSGIRVNSLTGNLSTSVQLFSFSGRGIPFECLLTYNTDHRAVSGPFGHGWRFSYQIRYLRHGNGDITIAWGSGRQDRFTAQAGRGGQFNAPLGLNMALCETEPGILVLQDKRGTKFLFENETHRKLTALEDPNGNRFQLHYLGSRLITLTDASNRKMQLAYDALDRLVSLTDASLSRSYQFGYDAADNLTAITDPGGNTMGFSYDGEHLLTGTTDKRGTQSQFSYLTPDHAADTRLPDSLSKDAATTQFVFDHVLRQLDVQDPMGQDWRFLYDETNQLVSMTDPMGKAILISWDSSKNISSVTDRNGHTHNFTYDVNGNRLTHTDGLGETRHWTYDGILNRMQTYTDRQSHTWTYGYDPQGNLTGITDPLTHHTTLSYDSHGQAIESISPAMDTTTYQYDANGNMTAVTDPLGATRNLTYDGGSRNTSITDANGNTTAYAYDALNRLTTTTNGLGQVTQYDYDEESRLVGLTETNGAMTTYSYDALGRRTGITDANGLTTTREYNAGGQITRFTNRNGFQTSFTYNVLGRMTSRTTPLGRIWQYGYDCEGNRTSMLDPLGQTISKTYDANGRLVSRTLPGGFTTTYGYDKNGNVTSASQPGSSFTMTYTPRNRLASQTDGDLGKSIILAYGPNGNLLRIDRPEGGLQTYTYNSGNRLKQIVAAGETFDFQHDIAGRRTQVSRPGTIITDYTYDAINRMTRQETRDMGTTLFQDFDYGQDQLTQMREDGSIHTMTFDALGRMTRDERSGAPDYDFNYTHDPEGNITGNSGTSPSFPDDPLSFTFNADNQIVSETGTDFGGPYTRTYTYDLNGNLIEKLGTGISTVQFSYDALNRLVTATDSAAGGEIYTYDALDRLQSITVVAPAPGEFAFQQFFYDHNGNIIVNYDALGIAQEQLYHNEAEQFSGLGLQPLQEAGTSTIPGFSSSQDGELTQAANADFGVTGLLGTLDLGSDGDVFEYSTDGGVYYHPNPPSNPLPNPFFSYGDPREGNDILPQPPKPTKDSPLFGYPGFLGNNTAPFPPREPRYGFPTMPDTFLLRKLGLLLFILLYDALGNLAGETDSGLGGLVTQAYDLLRRIVVFGPPSPVGPGGQDPYRPRFNGVLNASGSFYDNYTTFRNNQPTLENEFQRADNKVFGFQDVTRSLGDDDFNEVIFAIGFGP